MKKYLIIITPKGNVLLPLPKKDITETLPEFLNKMQHKDVKAETVIVNNSFNYSKN